MGRAAFVTLVVLLFVACADDDAPAPASSTASEGSFGERCAAAEGDAGAPPVGSLPPGQRLAWATEDAVWALVEGCAHPYRLWTGTGRSIKWSPDGEWVGFVAPDGELVLRSMSGARSPLSVEAQAFEWLPDGRRLVFAEAIERTPDAPAGPQALSLADVLYGTTQPLEQNAGSDFALSPSGEAVAYFAPEVCPPGTVPPEIVGVDRCNALWVRELAGGGARKVADAPQMAAAVPEGQRDPPSDGFSGLWSLGVSFAFRPRWSGDGEWLAFDACGISASGCVDYRYYFVLHHDTDELRAVQLTGDGVCRCSAAPQWAPNGSGLAVTLEGGRLYDAYPRPLLVVEAQSGAVRSISPPDVEDREPAWSPGGETLATASWPSVRGLDCQGCVPEVPEQGIYTMHADGSSRRQLTGSSEWRDTAPRWSRDGEWILFERTGPTYVPDRGFPRHELWLMRSDGSEQRMVTSPGELGDVFGGPTSERYGWWTGGD